MHLEELRGTLENLTNSKINNTTLAKALKMKLSSLSRKVKDRTPMKEKQVKALENYFKVDLLAFYPHKDNKKANKLNNNSIIIDRIGINPSCGNGTFVLDEAEITPVALGTALIKNILKVSNPANLKIFKASGDSMETIIEDGDWLLVDISRQDYINGGIFIITKDSDWYCKRLNKKMSGDLEIISDNKKYGVDVISKNNKDIDLQIKGRVIKNLSRGL